MVHAEEHAFPSPARGCSTPLPCTRACCFVSGFHPCVWVRILLVGSTCEVESTLGLLQPPHIAGSDQDVSRLTVQALSGPSGCLENRECGRNGTFARMDVSWEERRPTKATRLCGQGCPRWHCWRVRDAHGDQALGACWLVALSHSPGQLWWSHDWDFA